MKKLIVGCGPNWPTQKQQLETPDTQVIGLDFVPSFQPDVVRDLLRGLPFADSTFDVVEISHVLEHISGMAPMQPTDNFDFVMAELHRVLVPGGRLIIRVPYWKDDHAVEAAGHVRFFNENSFVNYYHNPYGKDMGQVQFSTCAHCSLDDTTRAYGKPAREVHIELVK